MLISFYVYSEPVVVFWY